MKEVQIEANTWMADGMVKYLKKCGITIVSHVIDPMSTGMDIIVIYTYYSKKTVNAYLQVAGFVKSQYVIV